MSSQADSDLQGKYYFCLRLSRDHNTSINLNLNLAYIATLHLDNNLHLEAR